MAALRARGLRVAPFKVGPSFVDRASHCRACGRATYNLDPWILGRAGLARAYRRGCEDADVAVVDGAGGLFDGTDGRTEDGSTAQVAKWLDAPVVLVMDCWDSARSIAATVQGFRDFDPGLRLAGAVFNRVGGGAHGQWLRDVVGGVRGVAPLGALLHDPGMKIAEEPWRPTTAPLAAGDEAIERLRAMVESGLDLRTLISIARTAGLVWAGPAAREEEPPGGASGDGGAGERGPAAVAGARRGSWDSGEGSSAEDVLVSGDEGGSTLGGHFAVGLPTRAEEEEPAFAAPARVRVGVARDEAFCLLYEENLALLQDAGAEVVPFSPLRGELPPGLSGLYFGGGYPELFAEQLSQNRRMLAGVKAFSEDGGVIYAEFAGLLYLCLSVQTQVSQYRLAGVFPFRARVSPQTHTGYVTVTTNAACPLFPRGLRARGSLFHSCELVQEQALGAFGFGRAREAQAFVESYTAQAEGRDGAGEALQEGFCRKNTVASYAHLHWGSCPELATAFVNCCEHTGEGPGQRLSPGGAEEWSSQADTELSESSPQGGWGSPRGSAGGPGWGGFDGGGFDGRAGLPGPSSAAAGGARQSEKSLARFHYSMSMNDLAISQSGPAWAPVQAEAAPVKAALGSLHKHTRSMGDLGMYYSQVASQQGVGICSFVPSATEVVFALGLGNQIVGVSDFCDHPYDVRVTRHIVCSLRQDSASKVNNCIANEIMLRELGSGGSGEPILEVDVEWLATVRPSLVLTFEPEDPGERPRGAVVEALHQAGLLSSAGGGTQCVRVHPHTLADVMDCVLRVGAVLNASLAAHSLVEELRERLRQVARAVAGARRRPRVLTLSGLAPLVVGGHWLPELASLAGGQDAVQEPGDPVERITWDQVRACEPEVLVLIPGSISSEQTLHEIGSLATLPGWWSLPAVQAGDVFLCDHVYYTRPGPRVVQGVEVLAGLLHPDLFPFSPPYNSVRKLTLRNGQRCRPRQLATYFEPCT